MKKTLTKLVGFATNLSSFVRRTKPTAQDSHSDTHNSIHDAQSEATDTTATSVSNAHEKKQDISNAIEKLKGKDKVGVAGEALSIAGGSVTGAAAAGTIASAAGATTLLGSSTLASAFGGIFVATTPIGWVIGSSVIAGAAGYGIAKMIRSGSIQDLKRKEIIKRLSKRLDKIHTQEGKNTDTKIIQINQLMVLLIANESITEKQAKRMIQLIEDEKLAPDTCLSRVKGMALSEQLIELPPGHIH